MQVFAACAAKEKLWDGAAYAERPAVMLVPNQGQRQPCPICKVPGEGNDGPPEGVWPHEMEVGAPAPRAKIARIPAVGIDAGSACEMPFPEKEMHDEDMAKRQGNSGVQERHRKMLAPPPQQLSSVSYSKQ